MLLDPGVNTFSKNTNHPSVNQAALVNMAKCRDFLKGIAEV